MSEPLPADHREPPRRDGPSPGTTGSPEEAPVLAGVILAAVIAALLMAAAAFLVARSARPAPGSLALAAIAAVGALA
ncbi:MAG TPA: hypothetical protein VHF26_11135, partial [Trebonia sp.]|nr:hypothetical protein [Trebonia sp.]